MAKSAAETREKMEAKHSVTALQKAMFLTTFYQSAAMKNSNSDWIYLKVVKRALLLSR